MGKKLFLRAALHYKQHNCAAAPLAVFIFHAFINTLTETATRPMILATPIHAQRKIAPRKRK